VNSHGNATNERVGMRELTLVVLTLFVFTAGTIVLLLGQTDPRDAQRSAVARNSWSKGAAESAQVRDDGSDRGQGLRGGRRD
jgi:hypothetical protein